MTRLFCQVSKRCLSILVSIRILLSLLLPKTTLPIYCSQNKPDDGYCTHWKNLTLHIISQLEIDSNIEIRLARQTFSLVQLEKFPLEYITTWNVLSPSLVKGQLISKWLLVSLILPKKERNNLPNSTMIPQDNLFSFVFRKNWRHQKVLSKLTDL